jgi:hypothetical protein
MNAQQIGQALQFGGLQGFGFSMPMLAPDWSPNGANSASFTVVDTTPGSSDQSIMTITSSANWAAPLGSSFINLEDGQPLPVTLVQAGGVIESAPGVLLTVFDQAWLRLSWLYCEILETQDASRPERDRGLSCRPVPRYIYFPNQSVTSASPTVSAGVAGAWDDLGFAGDARFYDGDGLQMDPIAVMAAFEAILTHYPGLQAVPLGSAPLNTIPLTSYLTGASSPLAADKVTRIRLVNPDGSPFTSSPNHLTGLTLVDADSALYELSGSPAVVGLDAVDQTSFPQYQHDRLVFGPSTNGRLTNTFVPPEPATSPAVSLARDYCTLRVIDLRSYLNGVWPAAGDPATAIQRFAAVRINENVSFLLNGNDVLGAIHTALDSGSPSKTHDGSPPESDLTLVVAQAIDGSFAIPAAPGTHAQWPLFPPGVNVDLNATLSINLKTQVTLQANWVTTSPNTATTGDIFLQIQKLPPNSWVRVYPRLLLPNATATRGDGQGVGVPASGSVVLYLTDPLTVRDPLTGKASIPTPATLMFDMVVVLANSNSRIYGGMTTSVANPLSSDPALTAAPGFNPCALASDRGICNAGVLGLGKVGKISPTPTSLIGYAEALLGEGTPRDAPRFPSMARRELLVAGAGPDSGSPSNSVSRTWTGVIGAGRIQHETVSAQSRIGAPGSLGGRETSVTGATTHGGRLAWDIARHALRRSQEIIPRLATLSGKDWNIPEEAAAVPAGHAATAVNGTMAGALLQTIAPICESPELNPIWDIPVTNQAVTTWITQNLSTSGNLQHNLIQALQNLENVPVPPEPAPENSLNPGASTIDQIGASASRLAIELERELSSGLYGRRDAQWALASAIKTARHLIYIETPGFCSTAHPWASSPPGSSGEPLPPYAADLIQALKDQMAKMPGLRVIVCVNHDPDFGPGYEGMASYETKDRLSIVQSMPLAAGSPPQSGQFILFHPIGFPGRYSRVETNVVIVDDIWTMIGGATIRRRGLTFDGSSDLVVTDTLIENGRSAAIRDFRRGLMANRLGVPADSSQPTYVALSESRTMFGAVQDALAIGGSGKIAPVWDGTTPGGTTATPLSADQANPDGRHFDEFTAAIVSLLGYM